MRRLVMIILCATLQLTASQLMNVAVCNLDGVRERVVSKAKTEASLVFDSAGVTLVWRECNNLPSPEAQRLQLWYVVRLRTGKPPLTVGNSSLDVMGKAYVEEHGGGDIAGAYYRAVVTIAEEHQKDPGVLLGFVMAHELGHLLLGAGHSTAGVMQATWRREQMDALNKRWLKFAEEDATRLRHALEGPAAALNQPANY